VKIALASALPLSLCLFLSIGCGKPKGEALLADQVMDFHQLYGTNCSGCHGVNGKQGPGPRLNDPLYLAIADRQSIRKTIEEGRPGTTMPALATLHGGTLSEEQVDAIVDGIEREWKKPIDLQGVVVPTYSIDKAPAGDEKKGQTAYQRNCMMCHGFGAFKGAAGSILDPHYLALASDQYLRTTSIVGRIDWGMPDWRHRIPGHPTSDQEISDVVAFLASKRPQPPMIPAQSAPASTAAPAAAPSNSSASKENH
jgi:cytochrome c oxidase cbb3-type subunit 3